MWINIKEILIEVGVSQCERVYEATVKRGDRQVMRQYAGFSQDSARRLYRLVQKWKREGRTVYGGFGNESDFRAAVVIRERDRHRTGTTN